MNPKAKRTVARCRATPLPHSIVRRGGRVALPPETGTFRLGQRVFFHLTAQGFVFADKPKRTFNGRLISSRVRRAIRSLALYGPRTRASGRRA